MHQIDQVYLEASTSIKKKITASLFPDKLYFDENTFIASKINPATPMILNLESVKLLKIDSLKR